MISERISDDIPHQMKILIMVTPILMHFCSFVPNGSVGSHYPIRRCITKSSALECSLIAVDLSVHTSIIMRFQNLKFNLT